MIRLEEPAWPLTPEQRFALEVLVDCSRVLRWEASDQADVVVVRIEQDGSPADDDLSLAGAARHAGGVVHVSARALAAVTRIAGAVDEQRSTRSDRYGRVPASDNLLAGRGIESDPVVSRLAVELRQTVIAAAGPRRVALLKPWPEGRRWAIAMTHDLDVVALWPVFSALRVAELAGKGRARDVLAVAGGALRAAFGDPVWQAASRILAQERELGIRATWFVITGTPTAASIRAGDITYSPESAQARRILRAVRDAGHEIALHGSFETFEDGRRFVAQKSRLAGIAGAPVRGVRQHFIRMRPGRTHVQMHAAGFEYDSTHGFADRNGFRLGIADVTPVWDDAARQPLPIEEVPFVWMDRALSKYQGVEDPDSWVADALRLARLCREVEGVWNGIWHPNLTAPLGYPGADRAFGRLLASLIGDAPWSATLADIVAWRRRRRSARGVGTTADGAVRLADGAGLELEDQHGRDIPAASA
jgi:hypothetical protein